MPFFSYFSLHLNVAKTMALPYGFLTFLIFLRGFRDGAGSYTAPTSAVGKCSGTASMRHSPRLCGGLPWPSVVLLCCGQFGPVLVVTSQLYCFWSLVLHQKSWYCNGFKGCTLLCYWGDLVMDFREGHCSPKSVSLSFVSESFSYVLFISTSYPKDIIKKYIIIK